MPTEKPVKKVDMLLRYAGDMMHLASFYVLLSKMRRHKTATGLSVRTQDMYTLVFLTRYVDLGWNHVSAFNTTLKVLFMSLSLFLSGATRWLYSNKSKDLEVVPRIALVLYAMVVATFFWYVELPQTAFEFSWKFSIALESVAIVPQLMLLPRIGIIETFTAHYLVLLGMYRMLYLASWIEQWLFHIPHSPRTPFLYIMTAVQNALFLDLLYIFYQHKRRNGMHMPVTIPLGEHDNV